MKNYTIDKMGNKLSSICEPDKMGNLPKYPENLTFQRTKAKNNKPSERSYSDEFDKALKLMK